MFRKQPKPRPFDYRPRYYDPDRSFLRDHMPASQDANARIESMKSRVSRQFRQGDSSAGFRSDTRQQIRRSNLRLVIILGLLLIGVYWFLTVHLPRILAAIE
ncbi:MAG TPA: hypothetical protein P5563_07225 [Saprospiraceae bacterium]|nr:hypothetical protein [Saprospiraceae bacterium]HRW75679.1 hypothetical protein [Saprospiraceae bacterium]